MSDLPVYIVDAAAAAVVVFNFYSTVQKAKLLFLTSSCVNMFQYIELMCSVKHLWDRSLTDVLSTCLNQWPGLVPLKQLSVLLCTASVLRLASMGDIF